MTPAFQIFSNSASCPSVSGCVLFFFFFDCFFDFDDPFPSYGTSPSAIDSASLKSEVRRNAISVSEPGSLLNLFTEDEDLARFFRLLQGGLASVTS